MNLEERVLRLLGRKSYLPATSGTIADKLRLGTNDSKSLNQLLRRLARSGKVVRLKTSRYVLPREEDFVSGRLLMNRRGGGRLCPDDSRLSQVNIPSGKAGTAMHNDRVLVLLKPKEARRGHSQSPSGKVVEILKRGRNQVVGTLNHTRQFWFVIPDDPRIPHDIYLTKPAGGKSHPRKGDKVVVEITEWPSRHNAPEGRIVETLGRPDRSGVDVESVIRQYDLSSGFPPAVLRDCRRFGDKVTARDCQGRLDCRDQLAVTIDPDDARDFDDAIFVERAAKNRLRLWVHIADVSHYVRRGTALDREARRRGNSTYLVDRVIPMLPEQLSNELCSLKPGVDRLAHSVEFLLTDAGGVLKTVVHSTVICSKKRFTYGDTLQILERSPRGKIEQMLHQAHRLAQRLRAVRFRKGALDLDVPEHKVRLDARGRLLSVEQIENDISHQLIEEFMLLANEAVATQLRQKKKQTIHRIHEEPDPEKLDDLRAESSQMGLRCGNLNHRPETRRFLASLKGHRLARVLRIGFLRCMKRARYSIEPIGHFGLAKKNYTHFTSPIRRYADLIVHRVLRQKTGVDRGQLEAVADHISLTERNSSDAEKDSKTVKVMAHLERQLRSGQLETYTALVTSVRSIGALVDVEKLGISGLVKRLSIKDDHYRFSPVGQCLKGKRTGRMIRPGDLLKVQIETVDSIKRRVDFKRV